MTVDWKRIWITTSRHTILWLLAAFTAVVLLLVQSTFWSNRVSSWMQLMVLVMALLSYFRPQAGLLTLALLVPLSQVGSRTLDSQMRGPEALVLAFLAGALVRGWTLRGFRSFPATRLETAALIFGLVVAASCAEQIWFLQVQLDYPWPFTQGVLTYASRDYLAAFRGYGMIFRAMLLLEGVALLVFTFRYARQSPEFARRLVAMLVFGAVGAVMLTFRDVSAELAQAGGLWTRFREVVAERRWSSHTDVNAAGSFFVMTMFVAFGLAITDRRFVWVWSAAGASLAVAAWMTHSRTAIFGMIVVAVCLLAASTIGRIIGVGRSIAVAVLASLILAVALWLYLPRESFGPGASEAVEIRWLFLGTTWRMLMANPLFGVGIGQYALWSVHFSTPALLAYYPGENAHNNFAQIAGELGITGLAAFVALLAIALLVRRPSGESQRDTIAAPVLAGLAAFIISWLGGHPLLVPEVAYPFWLALGVIAFGHFATSRTRYTNGLVALVVASLALSVPMRVHAKSQDVDFSRVSYGLSARRLITSRARFFVPAGAMRVDVPLRGRSADEEQQILIDVLVDDVAAETVAVTEREWRTAQVALPGNSTRRFHQIELHVRPSATENGDRERIAVEVGNWKIISRPNG